MRKSFSKKRIGRKSCLFGCKENLIAAAYWNCSLPTRPILVTPRRCAEAITPATTLYSASLFGRRCTSGWSACAATLLSLASSEARSGTTWLSHKTVPSKSTSIVTTTGSVVGGGGVPTGMFKFTEWFCLGIVMINMIISTSITSMRGVIFSSIIGSGSALGELPEPTFILIVFPLRSPTKRRAIQPPGKLLAMRPCVAGTPAQSLSALVRWFGDEADLLDSGTLGRVNNPADRFVACFLVATNMYFRLRYFHCFNFMIIEQFVRVFQSGLAQINLTIFIDNDVDIIRLALKRLVGLDRQIDFLQFEDNRTGDQKDDQQNQHDVDERRRVDF